MLALASMFSVAHGEGPQVAAKLPQKAVTLESLPLAVRDKLLAQHMYPDVPPRDADGTYRFTLAGVKIAVEPRIR